MYGLKALSAQGILTGIYTFRTDWRCQDRLDYVLAIWHRQYDFYSGNLITVVLPRVCAPWSDEMLQRIDDVATISNYLITDGDDDSILICYLFYSS